MIVVLGLFAVGVALWGFAGWARVWRLFAPREQETYYDPFGDR